MIDMADIELSTVLLKQAFDYFANNIDRSDYFKQQYSDFIKKSPQYKTIGIINDLLNYFVPYFLDHDFKDKPKEVIEFIFVKMFNTTGHLLLNYKKILEDIGTFEEISTIETQQEYTLFYNKTIELTSFVKKLINAMLYGGVYY
jgi:hypothetical protein